MYYFPDRLKTQLARIPDYPLTIVEAPSGFGKTTAVREYLKENLPHAAHEYWYTCLGEPSAKAWDSICELFGHVNSEIEGALKMLEMPTLDTLSDVKKILRKLNCQSETFLVIDNYQLVGSANPHEIMDAFSVHGNNRLHIIFITQQIQPNQQPTTHNAHVHTIYTPNLLFDKDSVNRYFRMAGMRLSNTELESVHKIAEGWAAAISLIMTNYQATGIIENADGINELVEKAIWNRLLPEEKFFLLSVCVLDGFTLRQAAVMLNKRSLPGGIADLLNSNDLIRYLPDKNTYTIHSILQSYLKNRFYNMPEDFQREALHRAGESCLAISDYYPAAQFFCKVGDFDAVLSMPFNKDYMGYYNERYLIDLIVRVVTECPAETLRKYPMPMTTFAFQLFFFGRYEEFGYLCGLIGAVLANPAGLNADELRKIRGEMEFIKSFTQYNDIEKMSAHHKTAYELLSGPSSYMFVDEPWTFGGVSVLYMFWSKTGQLENDLNCMDACLPYYIKLARGHGTSGDSVFRAEAMLARGLDVEAEILCHKAVYLGRSKRQISLCLCAELTLARIAILRGDADAYRIAVDSITQYSSAASLVSKPEWHTARMVDLCLATLTVTLEEKEGVADWLYQIDSVGKILFTAVIPYCQMIYGKMLLAGRRYNELYGISEPVLKMSEGMHYLLPQVYHFIYLAIAKQNEEQTEKAQEYLSKALAIALPDQVYMPFAEHGRALLPLLEAVKQTAADKDGIKAVMELCDRQIAGMDAVKKALAPVKPKLTPREREIAFLAQDGLSAKEIAKKLFISDATVKTILKSVYSKLDVHSKTQLSKINL